MKSYYILVGLVILIAAGIFSVPGYAEIDPESIVGIWLLDEDEGNQAADSSDNGHHGTILKNDKWVEGKFGSALENESGVLIQIEHNDAFSLETFTLVCWVNLTDAGLGSWQATFGKQPDNPGRNYRVEINTTGMARISFGSGGQAGAGSVVGTTMIVDQEWHHIAATYDMEQLKLYVDGVLEGTQPNNLEPATNNNPLQMGMIWGAVDELGMFNAALEEEDIIRIKDEGLMEILEPFAVGSSDKLITTWAGVKIRY